MFRTLKVGSLSGISLYIHATFWLMPLLVIGSNLGQVSFVELIFNLTLLFGVFASIVLHEFGHAFAARSFNINTRDITIYPIGGIARLEKMSEDPFEELVISLAGPAVNFIIALLLLPFWFNLVTFPYDDDILINLNSFTSTFIFYFRMLMASNVGLLVFNLLPIFPMDGGRVFRALLNLSIGFSRATRIAVFIGNLGAVCLVFFGFFSSNYSLILLAFFIFMAGRQELFLLRSKFNNFNNPQHSFSAFFNSSRHFNSMVWDPLRKIWIQNNTNNSNPIP